MDNKTFVLPLTPKQRAKFKKTRVTGHLRKKSEGTKRGCTKPRQQHAWLGIPSVTISAAVAKDRVVMWHAHTEPWNGATAAQMYQGPLLSALRHVWGRRRRYCIVEDGDRKGNQSSKGIAAKAAARIKAMMLPPRSPSLMPLDYAIWHKIEKKMLKDAPRGTETKDAYLKRFKKCAMTLPKGFVQKTIKRMKGNIQAIINARGYLPKND